MKKSIQKLEYELANAKARIAELEAAPDLNTEDLIFHSQILQNMSEGVYLVSARDSTIVYSNSVFDEMFGYMSGELVGKHVSIVNAPDIDPEKKAEEIVSTLQNTGQWQGEIKNIKKDGTVFWCYAKVIAYESPQYGSVYISVHQDVTEQKLIENELAIQREFDIRLIETAQLIILVLDTDGRIVSFNPYMEKLTGYTQDEVTGKDWFSTFLPGRDQQSIRELFRNSVNDIKTNGNVNPILAKDGHEICIEWYDSTIKDQSGNTLGVLAIGHDISEKRKTQKELQNTYQRLDEIQKAMNLVGIAIHIVDPLDGHFIYINNAACEMLGYSKEEMLSMGVPDIDPQFSADDLQAISENLSDNRGKLETTQIRKDGSIIQVEVTFYYFEGLDKQPGHFISFIIDLTERKKAEAEHEQLQKQLLQAQKMESIGHLTGGVAHDFNNMLAAILGYTGLIEKQLSTSDFGNEKLEEYLIQINKASSRARELVAQMLVFSRKPSDDVVDEIPVISVKPVIEEVVSLLASSIPATIEINSKIINDNLQIQINPVQFHQIILNLCINARDAIDDYGQININIQKHSLTDVCTSCHKSFTGDYVELLVSDTGVGISEHQLQRIFEPFYTTKEIGQGSGMGLSVVHGIVHAANGHILISSQLDKGTSISVLLPLIAEDEVPELIEEHDLDIDYQLQDLRIMIVDDEKQIASMMAEIFEMHGAETFEYSRSRQALSAFEENPQAYDLVLTDETMPELTGLDMSKSMLAIRSDLPVIISTGYSEHVNRKIAHDEGIAGFIMKPVNIEELIKLIIDLTSNSDV